MTTRISFLVLVFIFGISQLNVSAQNVEQKNEKTQFSIEIDPATFLFNGYAAHLRIRPKGSNRIQFGLGTYAMDLPEPFVSINSNNKDMGWNVRINQAYGLFAERFFGQVNSKWFLGSQVGIQEFKIERDYTDGSEKFSNLLVMAYAGYSWKPFKNNLYLKPWAGIGYTTKISGENVLGGNEYDISPITMFATLHIGYTF